MELVTFILFLTCQKPQLFNESDEPWNIHDQNVIKRAIKVCATDEHYSDTPCLSKFYKRAPQTYGAICGVAHKRSW